MAVIDLGRNSFFKRATENRKKSGGHACKGCRSIGSSAWHQQKPSAWAAGDVTTLGHSEGISIRLQVVLLNPLWYVHYVSYNNIYIYIIIGVYIYIIIIIYIISYVCIYILLLSLLLLPRHESSSNRVGWADTTHLSTCSAGITQPAPCGFLTIAIETNQ